MFESLLSQESLDRDTKPPFDGRLVENAGGTKMWNTLVTESQVFEVLGNEDRPVMPKDFEGPWFEVKTGPIVDDGEPTVKNSELVDSSIPGM